MLKEDVKAGRPDEAGLDLGTIIPIPSVARSSRKTGMRLAVICGLAVFGALMLSTARAVSQSAEQRVDVLAFGCDYTGAKTVTVLMLNTSLFGPNGRTVHVAAMQTANDGLRFSFTAPPGAIDIDYSVDGQKCMSGGGGLIVLPAHERHILISMNKGLFIRDWHAAKFVAGALPSVPIGISVVASASSTCPTDLQLRTSHPWGDSPETAAIIDAGAYYIDYVWGRHMFLKLTSGFDTLYLALPDATPVNSEDEYVRRGITEADLQQLTTHALNEGARCVQAPSGTSTSFPDQ